MADNHAFVPPSQAHSRSPCPALNALANHGYMYVLAPNGESNSPLTNTDQSSRGGIDLTFREIIEAIHSVYNISYPLAFLLTLVGFITSANISWRPLFFSLFIPSWTLHLSALSARGPHKITHDAAFVHADLIPSTAPDPHMVRSLIEYANEHSGGMSLDDLARYHALRLRAAPTKLDIIHRQIAAGEGALAWLILRGSDAVVPTERIRQWFGEEKLPDGWWSAVRPSRTIQLWEARKLANRIQDLAAATGT